MNTTDGSVHPGIKALVAGCSLALMSAFVWYSHIQAQSKSILISDLKSKTVSTTVNPGAPAPPSAPRHSAEQQRTILLSGLKSYTGSTIIKAETLQSIQDKTPDNATRLFRSKSSEEKPDKPEVVLMSGSKAGIITTTASPSTPAPPTNLQPLTDRQKVLLMTGSGTTDSTQKSSEPKSESKQPKAQTQSKESGAKQTAAAPAKPGAPNDVLMLSSKALTQPVFSVKKIEVQPAQNDAPTAGQNQSQQIKPAKNP